MLNLRAKSKYFFKGDITRHLLWGWREINIMFLNLGQPLYYNWCNDDGSKNLFFCSIDVSKPVERERDFLNVCEYVHNKMDYFPALYYSPLYIRICGGGGRVLNF